MFKLQITGFEKDLRAPAPLRAASITWLAVAASLFAVRAIMYGPGLTGSLRALFGSADSDLFGAVSHTIDLLDPMLALATIGAVLMAFRMARTNAPASPSSR
ncbi:MAG: hypothetical protein AB7K67_08190 [Hyphomicrobiaceae bacterium]